MCLSKIILTRIILSRYLRDFSLHMDCWAIVIPARQEGHLEYWTARGCWPEALLESESKLVTRVAGWRRNRPVSGARRSSAVTAHEPAEARRMVWSAAWESSWWVAGWSASSVVVLSQCLRTSGSLARRNHRCSWPANYPSAMDPHSLDRGNTYQLPRSPRFCSSAKWTTRDPIYFS